MPGSDVGLEARIALRRAFAQHVRHAHEPNLDGFHKLGSPGKAVSITEEAGAAALLSGAAIAIRVAGGSDRRKTVERVGQVPGSWAGVGVVEVDHPNQGFPMIHAVVGREIAVADDLGGRAGRDLPAVHPGYGDIGRGVVHPPQQPGSLDEEGIRAQPIGQGIIPDRARDV